MELLNLFTLLMLINCQLSIVNCQLIIPSVAQPAQVEQPQVISPGGGTRFYHAEFNPNDANNIAIGTDMSGTYTTRNGGASWEIKNVLSTAFYAFNPHDENTVYALGSYLWVSHDKGATFAMLYPKADKITGIKTGLGEGGNFLFGTTTPDNRAENEAAVPNGAIRSLVVDADDANLMYFVAYSSSAKNTLYQSTDGGETWTAKGSFGETLTGQVNGETIDGYYYYSKLFIDPATKTLSMINNTGYYELDSEGTVTKEIKCLNLNGDLYFDGTDLHIYLAAEGGIVHSINGDAFAPVSTGDYVIKRIAAANATTLYAAAIGAGILTSKDGGANWTLAVDRRANQPASVANSITAHHWIEFYDRPNVPDLGWLGHSQWLTACQSDPDIAIFSTAGNAYITHDGGATWQDLSSVKEATGYRTTGLDCLNVYDYDIDPFDSDHQLLSATDCGLFESFDSGATWNRIPAPIKESKYANTAYSTVFDPDIQGVFWVAYCGTHDLHLGRNIRGVCNEFDLWKDDPTQERWSSRGGIACRVNGAWSHWTGAGIPEFSPIGDDDGASGLPYKALMTDVVVDPLSPKEPDQRVLYANAMGYGVYKSTDGGRHWAKWNGIMQTAEKRMTTWRLAWNTDYSRLYVVFEPEGSTSGFAAGNENLDFIDYHPAEGAVYYLSLDGARDGSDWTKLASMPVVSGRTNTDNYHGTLPQHSVMAFTGISLANDGTLYAAGRARSVGGSDYARNYGGAWMTKDDGETWTMIFPSTSYVTDIKVDSRNNNRLYIATLDGGKVFVSTKGDETTVSDWTELPNFNFKHPQRIVEDPQDEYKVYVTTFAGGVWRMPTPMPTPAQTELIVPTPFINPDPVSEPDKWFYNFRLEHFAPDTEPLLKETMGATTAFDDEGFWEYNSYHSHAVGFSANLPTLSMIEYGETTDYGKTTVQSDSYYYNHLHYITGLTEQTTYHYRMLAQDYDGNVITSEDYTFTTNAFDGSEIRIESLPFTATVSGTADHPQKYVLMDDLTSNTVGINVKANYTEIDLNGHTLVYDNGAPDVVSESSDGYAYNENTSMGIRSGLWNYQDVKIVNGTVKQGDNGITGHQNTGGNPLYLGFGGQTEVAGITAQWYGENTGGIAAGYASGIFSHNILIDNGTGIDDRHQGIKAMVIGDDADNVVAWNSLRRFRHQGIMGGGYKHHNEVYADSYDTNSFLIAAGDNGKIMHNKLFGTGYMPIGTNWASNTVISNNFIYMHGTAPTFRSDEYHRLSGVYGLRLSLYDDANDLSLPLYDNCLYENNTIVLKAWDACEQARGIGSSNGARSTNIRYTGNTVKVEVTGMQNTNFTGADYTVTCVDLCGSSRTVDDGLSPEQRQVFRNNRLIGNACLVSFGSDYGISGSNYFYNTTLEKIETHSDYFKPVRLGYWYWNTFDNRMIDTEAVNFDFSPAPVFHGSTGYMEVSYGTSHTAQFVDGDNNLIANKEITIDIDNHTRTYSFTTDGNGYATFDVLTVQHVKAGTGSGGAAGTPTQTDYENYVFTDGKDSSEVFTLELLKLANRIKIGQDATATEKVAGSGRFRAYPNPVERGQNMTLTMDAPFSHAQVEVYTITGACLTRTTIHENVSSLKMPGKPGVYLIKVRTADREITIKAVVK